jgi:hypothetical protein
MGVLADRNLADRNPSRWVSSPIETALTRVKLLAPFRGAPQ